MLEVTLEANIWIRVYYNNSLINDKTLKLVCLKKQLSVNNILLGKLELCDITFNRSPIIFIQVSLISIYYYLKDRTRILKIANI